MELTRTRLATTSKLRQEWDRRLENNALSVDRLLSNRGLWLQAGGIDPVMLATPTEMHLEEASRTVGTLRAMLERHGPAGGLDTFVEDIHGAVKKLKVVSWESIRNFFFNTGCSTGFLLSFRSQ